jgi:hypothetical protein
MNRPGVGTGWKPAGRATAEIRVLRSPLTDGEAAEVQPPARTRVGPQGLGSMTSAIRLWKLKFPGGSRRFENGWAR